MKPTFENVSAPKVSCEKRPLNAAPIAWPHVVREFERDGERYRLRPIGRKDVEGVLRLYNDWYPYLYGSSRQFMLERSFYERDVAMSDTWQEDAVAKPYMFGAIERVSSGELIFAFAFYKDPYDRSLQTLAIVLAPKYRGAFFTHPYIEYVDALIEAGGFEYVFGTAQAKDVVAQKIALRAGFRVGGLMPGAFRWSYDGETGYRDLLVYMYRFCGDAEKHSTRPEDWQLAPAVAEAYAQLSSLREGDLGEL